MELVPSRRGSEPEAEKSPRRDDADELAQLVPEAKEGNKPKQRGGTRTEAAGSPSKGRKIATASASSKGAGGTRNFLMQCGCLVAIVGVAFLAREAL